MSSPFPQVKKLFVGIGAGAVQLGLWAYYAFRQRAEVVLAEIDERKVTEIRNNGSCYSINVSHFDRIDSVEIGPVRILDPSSPSDRGQLLNALHDANDIVTAVPSTAAYVSPQLAGLLQEALSTKPRPVTVFASENEIGAARKLEKMVFPHDHPAHIQFSETVIERMGGVHDDRMLIRDLALHPITPSSKLALLVEDFDRIVVEACRIPPAWGYSSIFSGFLPTDHIGVYEELKLLGHNAVHFLLGVIGVMKGYKYMSEYADDPDLVGIGHEALMQETGTWFKARHAHTAAEVTTDVGYAEWASQLERRIVNPFLFDRVDRVTRDAGRKLAWNDRIAHAMRKALQAGLKPRRYALGVGAALFMFDPHKAAQESLVYHGDVTTQIALDRLGNLWDPPEGAEGFRSMMGLVRDAIDVLSGWNPRSGQPLCSYLKERSYL